MIEIVIVAAAVGGAVFYLIRRSLKKPSCGDCGCAKTVKPGTSKD